MRPHLTARTGDELAQRFQAELDHLAREIAWREQERATLSK